MTQDIIPLIIRGRIITDNLVEHQARGGELRFLAPDVSRYMDELVLKDPLALRDLYALSLDEIIDFLGELEPRLDHRTNPHMARAMEMVLRSNVHSPEMALSLAQVTPRILRRESVEEVIEQNIGRAYLEGWVDRPMRDRQVAVRAFGARAVHVIAGNGSVIALQTLIANAVTRGDAIVKIPSNDPFYATALARTMIDMAPDHPVTRHFSVAYWKGGDARVEQALYDPRNIEKIVAWGGFAGMRSIRRYLAPGVDLVALDPKISGSIIGREAFASDEAMADAAARAAADVGYMNQSGCVSAKSLFVVSGVDEAGIARANRFGEMLFQAIQDLPTHLSSPHPAFSPALKAEIDGIRYSEAFRVIGGRGAEGAVIVSQDEEEVDFSELLDCRVANVVPTASLEDALRHITVHMQTIGIYPDALKSQVRDECALRGGQRIVSLGRALSANWAGPHDAMEPLRRMVRWLRDDTLERESGIILP